MDFIIIWMQETSLHTWLAENSSWFVYPLTLAFHSLGMGIIVGMNVAISLRILGAVPELPLAPLARFYSFVWFGLIANAISGVGLVFTDPEKLLNWILWVKFSGLALALVTLGLLRAEVFGNPNLDKVPLSLRSKVLAGALIFFWALTIWGGRFSAYPELFGGS